MPPRKKYCLYYTTKVNSRLNLGKDFTCFLQVRLVGCGKEGYCKI